MGISIKNAGFAGKAADALAISLKTNQATNKSKINSGLTKFGGAVALTLIGLEGIIESVVRVAFGIALSPFAGVARAIPYTKESDFYHAWNNQCNIFKKEDGVFNQAVGAIRTAAETIFLKKIA